MPSPGESDLSNCEVVTLAVYLLGGDSKVVDTEDIAVKAAVIAPGRFSWRRYPEQINIEHVRLRLSDAAKSGKFGYLAGSKRDGWRLTEAGVEFCRNNSSRLSGDLSRLPMSQTELNWFHREKSRVLGSDAYAVFLELGADHVSYRQAEALFKLDEYVQGSSRDKKISRIVNVFSKDPDLKEVVAALEPKVREGS